MLGNFTLDDTIRRALAEDIGTGDITTLATVDKNKQTEGRFIAKEEGVICGLPVLQKVFEILDAGVRIKCLVNEGDSVKKGDGIALISGCAQSILSGERVALNFLQRLSGVATRTRAVGVARIASSTATSASDTGDRSGLVLTFRSTARNRSIVIESA